MNNKTKYAAVPIGVIFSVAFVLFSSHAGGGFASGNQAFQNFVVLGGWAPWAAILAMLLFTLTVKEAMIMYNTRKLGSYKELFETLYHPFDKIEILFEIFFYIMVLMAVGAAIATAASTLETTFGMNYNLAIFVVGVIILILTIFGAGLVRKASTIMGLIILVSAISIFIAGIIYKAPESVGTASIAESLTTFDMAQLPNAILRAFTYAGFQLVVTPTMIVCGMPLITKKSCEKSMWISFALNAVALTLSVIMLMKWMPVFTAVENGTTIPTLTSINAMGITSLNVVYSIALLACLISTGVTTVFGFVGRFEKMKALQGIKNQSIRSAIVSAFIMIISMSVATFGLSNIIKYGYGYCGYLGILIIVIPFLTVGHIKNKKYIAEHPDCQGEVVEEEESMSFVPKTEA
jgi:uncharacterized membrane protein YkvI